MGNEIENQVDYRQVYIKDDDDSTFNMWLLDCYNKTAENGPSILCSLLYLYPANESNDDQTDSNGGLTPSRAINVRWRTEALGQQRLLRISGLIQHGESQSLRDANLFSRILLHGIC
jgi:hypothetical protein